MEKEQYLLPWYCAALYCSDCGETFLMCKYGILSQLRSTADSGKIKGAIMRDVVSLENRPESRLNSGMIASVGGAAQQISAAHISGEMSTSSAVSG